jgi:hypothetical protein
MFYPLKHLLFPYFVIFKLNCNNIFVNKIMVLNASYVCLLHSHFINNYLIWILKDEALISKVFLSQTHQTSPGKRFGKTMVWLHAAEGWPG